MATVQPLPTPRGEQGTFEALHPYWTAAFDNKIRSQQLAEDDQAWTAVTGTLITIVTVGVIVASITVTMCLWH